MHEGIWRLLCKLYGVTWGIAIHSHWQLQHNLTWYLYLGGCIVCRIIRMVCVGLLPNTVQKLTSRVEHHEKLT